MAVCGDVDVYSRYFGSPSRWAPLNWYVRRALGWASVEGVTESDGGESSEWRTFGEHAIYESPEVWLASMFRDLDVTG